ncbi:hypothetical protein F383_08323 [Gossypium arboreum]|uniref:Uncharacterized protein n=1 Tax=Gossypium arboreum TaxID=29729 RepID=A0A0B0MY35_GOSAR|nr:hypothetical protein F383_31423 [Gossypium arboreum]KHG19429.1 hypothetical protein F383_08323 [Gossypium arboreum]
MSRTWHWHRYVNPCKTISEIWHWHRYVISYFVYDHSWTMATSK